MPTCPGPCNHVYRHRLTPDLSVARIATTCSLSTGHWQQTHCIQCLHPAHPRTPRHPAVPLDLSMNQHRLTRPSLLRLRRLPLPRSKHRNTRYKAHLKAAGVRPSLPLSLPPSLHPLPQLNPRLHLRLCPRQLPACLHARCRLHLRNRILVVSSIPR